MMNFARPVLAAVALVSAVALAGCAGASDVPQAAGGTSVASTPASAPDSTPTPTPSAGPTAAPAQVFGGDCGAVLTTAQVAGYVGSSVELSSEPELSNLAVPTLSGLNCHWQPTSSAGGGAIVLTVLPASAGIRPVTSVPKCIGGLGCSFVVAASGYRFDGMLATKDADNVAHALSTVKAVVAKLSARAAAAGAPPAVAIPSGAWSAVPTCATLATSASLASVLASSSAVGVANEQAPGDSPAALSATQNLLTTRTCSMITPAGKSLATFIVRPGSGWAASVFAAEPGYAATTLAGVDRAYVKAGSINATVGANSLFVATTSLPLSKRLLAALIATLPAS